MRLSKFTRDVLQQELTHLREEALPRLAGLVIDAKSQGDTSQNPDYFIVAEEERQVNQRVAEVVAALAADDHEDEPPLDVVGPGRLVVVDFGDGDAETLVFGSVEERCLGLDVMTPGSPLGERLLGRKVGESVETPSGVRVVVKDVKAV